MRRREGKRGQKGRNSNFIRAISRTSLCIPSKALTISAISDLTMDENNEEESDNQAEQPKKMV